MISRVAADENVDLVVMATHGYGGLARLALGSVATGTLQRANVPLLLVRPASLRESGREPG
jgi:nucleotide-binding universal stress UspA family protein